MVLVCSFGHLNASMSGQPLLRVEHFRGRVCACPHALLPGILLFRLSPECSSRVHLTSTLVGLPTSNLQSPCGTWRSLRIMTAFQTTEIGYPSANVCFCMWTPWHYISLRFLPYPNAVLPRLHSQKIQVFRKQESVAIVLKITLSNFQIYLNSVEEP